MRASRWPALAPEPTARGPRQEGRRGPERPSMTAPTQASRGPAATADDRRQTRDDGFARADIDVGLLSDPKMRRLARRLPDEGAFASAVVAYVSTLLES